MAQAIDLHLPVRRRLRIGGAWAWALTGFLVVAAAVALDPVADAPAPQAGPGADASIDEDWRGNSARLTPLR